MNNNSPYIFVAVIWGIGLIVVTILLLNDVYWCWPAMILFMLPTLSVKHDDESDGEENK